MKCAYDSSVNLAKNKITEAVKYFGKLLKVKGIRVSKIVLFGSHANGKNSRESDIDIIVVSNDFKGKDIFKRAILTKDAEIESIKKFMVPFDIFTMTDSEFKNADSLVAMFVQDGTVIHV